MIGAKGMSGRVLCVSESPGTPGRQQRQVSPQEGALSFCCLLGFDERSFHFSVVALQIELRLMVFSLSS